MIKFLSLTGFLVFVILLVELSIFCKRILVLFVYPYGY